MKAHTFSRRSFLALIGTAPFAARAMAASAASSPASASAPARKQIPIGIQMFSVRDDEKADMPGTLKALRGMGYECVEFWGPYFEWTTEYAREIRKQLDDLGLRCYSNHTRRPYFADDRLPHAIELNQILGSKYLIMDHAGRQSGLDGWKETGELLGRASEKLRAHGLNVGYHNYDTEFRPIDGVRPIDVLIRNTPKEVALQLDVATCMAAGADPIEYIKANAGRVKTYHLKDWSPEPDKRSRVLLGEGIGPWKQLLEVAESVGGVEHYLIEQEGSRFSQMETAKRCLDNFKEIRGA